MELTGGGKVMVWSDRRDWWLDRVNRETHRNVGLFGLVELLQLQLLQVHLQLQLFTPRLRKGK